MRPEDEDAGGDFGEADADGVWRGAGGQHDGRDELHAVEARQQREAHREGVEEEDEAGEGLPDSACSGAVLARTRW